MSDAATALRFFTRCQRIDLLKLNCDGSHAVLFEVDVTTIAAFFSLNLKALRLEANWLLIISFRARFCGCMLGNFDMPSGSDEVASLLLAVADDERNNNEGKVHFSVKAEIFLFLRSRNF